MATDDHGDTETYTPGELRRMNDAEARDQLTVNQYERREKLLALHEQAAETDEQFAAEAAEVEALTVSADPEQLGTEVDVYGNTLLVRVEDGNDRLQRHGEAVETLLEAAEGEADDDLGGLADDRRDELAAHLRSLLDELLVRWDGESWADLRDAHREAILLDASDKWGVDGLLLAVVNIVAAVHEDREERVSVVESFRGAPGHTRR